MTTYSTDSDDRNVTNCDDCGAWLREGDDCQRCLDAEDRFGHDAHLDAIGNCVWCGSLTQLDGQFCSGPCADMHEADCARQQRRERGDARLLHLLGTWSADDARRERRDRECSQLLAILCGLAT